LLGAGIGSMKGVSANEANPGASPDEKAGNIAGGVMGGLALGGLAAGPGVSAAKKLGSAALGVFKKADMEIPHDEDNKMTDEEKEVQESPNEDEKRRMVNSVTEEDEKKEYYKNKIEKQALLKLSGYMGDINCEQCGYAGKPDSEDGRCPQCGAMCGVMPKEAPQERRDDLHDVDHDRSRLYDDIERGKNEINSFY